jgi:hypothetical protein
MSPCIGAGSKNDDNTFNGVLMGKIKDKTKEKEPAKHGLYGFNKGEEVFGFKEDGTAFIGKSSGGRIKFDGNNSTIKSASYDTGKGLLLDLDNPTFDLKYGNDSLIKFDPTDSDKTDPMMILKSPDGNTKLDLVNGIFELNKSIEVNPETKDKYTRSIKISNSESNNTPFQILGNGIGTENDEGKIVYEKNEDGSIKQNKFSVGWDGIAYMTGAQIEGDLNAGTVGGWNIGSSKYNDKPRKTLSCRSDYKGSLTKYAEGLYNMELVQGLLDNQSLELSLINYESFDIVNDSDGVGIPIGEDIFSFR